ncbi:MAG: biotin--[acetyl-CoA-carboxylase] ligase, partial [Acidimicrobiales bacterium]
AGCDPPAIVVGIGVNLRKAGGLPPEAISADEVTDRPVDADGLLDRLLAGLAGWYGRWDDVAAAYRRRCASVGQRVRVDGVAGALDGVAVDVDGNGHLVVEAGGSRHTIAAGDVVHLRPA